jgi:DNA-binding response OmpR family regulator
MLKERRPALVLLDINLPGHKVSTVLRQIKIRQPQTWCLVLTDDVRQQQMVRDAGADVVLLKGFPAARLFATIEGLLT